MPTYSRRGLHGRVVHDIGLRILRGDLAPGAMVEHDAVEREYDVSRTVVREAIKVLSAKGLLEARPKRGTVVRERAAWNLLDPDLVAWQFEGKPDQAFILALNELRLIFEPAGAGLAAERATDDEVDAIQAALEKMRAQHGNVEAVTATDIALHRAILTATHNELLVRFESLIEAGLRVRHHLAFSTNWDATYLDLHAEVVAAIAQRLPGAAESAMRTLLVTAAVDAERALAAFGGAHAEALEPGATR